MKGKEIKGGQEERKRKKKKEEIKKGGRIKEKRGEEKGE